MKHLGKNKRRAVATLFCILVLGQAAPLYADKHPGQNRTASTDLRNLAAMEERFLAQFQSYATTELGKWPGSGGSDGMGEELLGPLEGGEEKEEGALLSGSDSKGRPHGRSIIVRDGVYLRADSNAERDSYIAYARHGKSGRVYALDPDNGELLVCENEDWVESEGIMATTYPVTKGRDDLSGRNCGGEMFAVWTPSANVVVVDTKDALARLEKSNKRRGKTEANRKLKRVMAWFDKAEKGDAEARCHLGWAYQGGRGVPRDPAMAANWFRMAAEQGHPVAQVDLGFMFAQGRGVSPKNPGAAREWFRKALAGDLVQAAERGDVFAQTNLGRMYVAGAGCRELKGNVAWRNTADSGCVEKDEESAAEWFRRAAEQGHADAQGRLGVKYLTGVGVKRDERQAAEWLRKAAEQDEGGAQFMLGLLYMQGHGVPNDPRQGTEWLRKAEEQGVRGAKQAMGLLTN